MTRTENTIAFLSRIGLAGVLLHQGVASVAPGLFPALPKGMILHSGLGPLQEYAVWPIAALLGFVSLWLILGICSRVVAAWGTAIMPGLCLACVIQDPTDTGCRLLTLAALGLALPVMWMGGGYLALCRRGWSVPI
ncbi:MAG TPA: hypothetical protein DEA05_11645 [Rhodobacteraceae bacterium]|nr:hypothetical protein [Paracoccaceae bacterium]